MTAWTNEWAHLDAALLKPFAVVGAAPVTGPLNDPAALRTEAKAAADNDEAPAALVKWARVRAALPHDATAMAEVPRLLALLGEQQGAQ